MSNKEKFKCSLRRYRKSLWGKTPWGKRQAEAENIRFHTELAKNFKHSPHPSYADQPN